MFRVVLELDKSMQLKVQAGCVDRNKNSMSTQQCHFVKALDLSRKCNIFSFIAGRSGPLLRVPGKVGGYFMSLSTVQTLTFCPEFICDIFLLLVRHTRRGHIKFKSPCPPASSFRPIESFGGFGVAV